MQTESWDRYASFQREHAAEQADRAWERCAAVSVPPGRIVTGIVVDRQAFRVFLDLGEPWLPVLLVEPAP